MALVFDIAEILLSTVRLRHSFVQIADSVDVVVVQLAL